ncbi:MAG TPA: plastocyanin/azurin family copper-binding protein [Ktedonobacterales bacterium]|nr:plastocyanin/azurin family copper-binding protein [Ktedonobacterales bacterium]
MKKLAVLVLPLLLLGAIAAAGCGKTPGGANTGPSGPVDHVDLTTTDFAQTAITIKAGVPFKFVNPSDTGGLHIICAGDNGKCIANPDAPKELADPGFTTNPGDTTTVTFDKPGTYKIACTVHPAMNLTITVE